MPFPRGARPTPRHRLAAARPHVISGQTPVVFCQPVNVPGLLFWGNDTYGDCVTAEEAFAKNVTGQSVSNQEAIGWASQNDFLNGADLEQVLAQMAVPGEGLIASDGVIYDDGSAVSVDWTNRAVLSNAISLGPVKIGVASSQFDGVPGVGSGSGWFMTGFQPDSNEDHCVSLWAYGTLASFAGPPPTGVSPAIWAQAVSWAQKILAGGVSGSTFVYGLFTWSSVGFIDEPSLLAIIGEAWLRQPTTISDGPAPDPTPDSPGFFQRLLGWLGL